MYSVKINFQSTALIQGVHSHVLQKNQNQPDTAIMMIITYMYLIINSKYRASFIIILSSNMDEFIN